MIGRLLLVCTYNHMSYLVYGIAVVQLKARSGRLCQLVRGCIHADAFLSSKKTLPCGRI